MRFPPPDVIASWPPPNYDNPETRGPGLLIAELTILPIALITLAFRLYVRFRIVRSSGWDDWLMIGAAFFGIGLTLCVILASQLYGWNIHVWDLNADQIATGRQVSIAAQTIFLFASGLAKTSILTSYLRIALYGSWFRRLTWAAIVLVVTAIFVFLIVLWTQCIPTSSYWNLFADDRDCLPEAPPLVAQTIISVITDTIVFLLPLPTLSTLRLPLGQRIVLMILFGMGIVVVVAGCLRAYWVHYVLEETYDITWDGFEVWIWTAVEVNLAIIAGCVPLLKPLFYPSYGSKRENTYRRRKGPSANLVLSTFVGNCQKESGTGDNPADDLENGDNTVQSSVHSTSQELHTPLSPELFSVDHEAAHEKI